MISPQPHTQMDACLQAFTPLPTLPNKILYLPQHTHPFPPSILQLFFVVPRRVLCVRMWEFERCVKVSRDIFRSFWKEKKSKGEKQQIQMLQYRSQKRNISRKEKNEKKTAKSALNVIGPWIVNKCLAGEENGKKCRRKKLEIGSTSLSPPPHPKKGTKTYPPFLPNIQLLEGDFSA